MKAVEPRARIEERIQGYLRAAELIDEGKWMCSCNAIDDLEDRLSYVAIFELGVRGYGGRNCHQLFQMGSEEARNLRVLMLCLAAAIEDAGGLYD